MKKIVLASNNSHKIKEFKKILNTYEILSLKDIGFDNEIIEDGETFFENAYIKAKVVSDFLKENSLDYDVIADDSGLCVPALDGKPGVYSARYAEEHNDKANRDKLILDLKDKDNKEAFFICQIVLLHPDDTYSSCDGKTYGTITFEERGNTDFGYDCIFLSNELGITFGEASEEEKNKVSHRGRAIEKLKSELK